MFGFVNSLKVQKRKCDSQKLFSNTNDVAYIYATRCRIPTTNSKPCRAKTPDLRAILQTYLFAFLPIYILAARISVQIKNFVAMLQCCKIAVMRYAVYIKYTLCFLSNFLVLFYFSIFPLSFCVHAGIHTRLPGPYFLRVLLLFAISCKDWASYVCCRF